MDIVSFETAKKIKEAGFPQPHPGDFQFWYVEDNKNKWEVTVIVKCGGIQEAILNVYGSRIFAPTATDILRLLPGVYLCVNDKSIWRAEWAGVSCYDNDPPLAKGEAPAEVAAVAWLSLNAKASNDSGVKFGEWQPIQIMDMNKLNEA